MRNDPWGELKAKVVQARTYRCELSTETFPHEHEGGLELHHLLLTRNDVQKSELARRYATHEYNVVLLCSRAHMGMARMRAVRAWLIDLQVERYGRAVLDLYLLRSPLKVKKTLGELLV